MGDAQATVPRRRLTRPFGRSSYLTSLPGRIRAPTPRRSLAGKRYVYFWVDGVHFSIRLEEDRQCILVVMGATKDGKKELVAIADGYRESAQSWKEILLGLKKRGLEHGRSRSGTALSASRRRSPRSSQRHARSAAGSTRPRTC